MLGRSGWLFVWGALLGGTVVHAEPPLPYAGPGKHLGVVTCAGSTCHGAAEPFAGTAVLQNEYLTWSREDRHAQAYKVLLSDESKRIARNLGLEAAHTAPLCLDCHADNVAEALRGNRFQLSDGVGCEACHGGAGSGADAAAHGGWLTPHISGASHQENVAAGLYPTADPVQRARLCLSCHFGNDKRFVTHRIMGAGHPRMSFELDTFTAIQPAHFAVDDDYRQRKSFWEGAKVWAIGQAMTVGGYLDALLDSRRGRDGLFPELVLFDCHACHSPLSAKDWQPHPERGLGPGRIRVNDANMLILARLIRHIDPALGRRFSAGLRQLHQKSAADPGAFAAAARALRAMLPDLTRQIVRYELDGGDLRAVLKDLLADGVQGRFRDYAAAEQLAMAAGALISTLEQGTDMAPGGGPVNQAMDKVYAALEAEDRYRPAAFAEALKGLRAALPR